MNRILVDAASLKAIVTVCLQDDSHAPPLSCVQIREDGSLTATDGHRLYHFRPSEKPYPAEGWPGLSTNGELKLPLLIHHTEVTRILKAWKKPKANSSPASIQNHIAIELDLAGGLRAGTFDGSGVSWVSFHATDGNYPQWERIIPTGEPKLRISVNADYLAKLAQVLGTAADDLNRTITLDFFESGKPFIGYTRTYERKAVCMPLRIKDVDPWYQALKAE